MESRPLRYHIKNPEAFLRAYISLTEKASLEKQLIALATAVECNMYFVVYIKFLS